MPRPSAAPGSNQGHRPGQGRLLPEDGPRDERRDRPVPAALGDLPLAKLGADDIGRFCRLLRERGGRGDRALSVHTIRRTHGVVHGALAHVRWGWLGVVALPILLGVGVLGRPGVYDRCMGKVRTNIEIEDEYLKAIMVRYGVHTKTEAVDLALRHLAGQPMTRDEALSMRGANAIGEIPEDVAPTRS